MGVSSATGTGITIVVILISYYSVGHACMPRVTTKGQVTIPKEIRETLGIEPGDEVAFEETDDGYAIRKQEPTTAEGGDPFAKHRGSAGSVETMPERMRRLRGAYPREADPGTDGDRESEDDA
jgi:AbrB family looped-hinge helix DNA binding protein